jgi:hypothetical protein
MVGLALMHLVPGLLLLGFAYIILIKANKESGNMKLVGQIIGWGLVAVCILAALSCAMKKNCSICQKAGIAHQCAAPAAPEAAPAAEKK